MGAQFLAEKALTPPDESSTAKLITFDMGGTSTDVSLIDGKPQITTESIVGGCPIRIPILDIHTIGAGGGSIASIDLGGVLRVGPESAGADPGPACYGQSDLPTVTDANLVLGRIIPDNFLAGQLALDPPRSWKAMAKIGAELGLSPIQAALGIVEIANAHMERALRVISIERGYDPGDFTLISFGGAGGLHAARLAKNLGIKKVLIPPNASTLSAFGMLAADVVKDYTKTVMLPGDTPTSRISAALDPLINMGISEVRKEGISLENILVSRMLDIRYHGQSYELTIPFDPSNSDLAENFHSHHERVYGYKRTGATLEIVNLRVQVIGKVPPPHFNTGTTEKIKIKSSEYSFREVQLEYGRENIPVYRGETLTAGMHFSGPALVVRSDTTILIPVSYSVNVDDYKNLWMDIDYAH